jgi:hypothetical protein
MPSLDAQHSGDSLLDRRQGAQRVALLQMQKAAQAVADEFNQLLAETIEEGRKAVAHLNH